MVRVRSAELTHVGAPIRQPRDRPERLLNGSTLTLYLRQPIVSFCEVRLHRLPDEAGCGDTARSGSLRQALCLRLLEIDLGPSHDVCIVHRPATDGGAGPGVGAHDRARDVGCRPVRQSLRYGSLSRMRRACQPFLRALLTLRVRVLDPRRMITRGEAPARPVLTPALASVCRCHRHRCRLTTAAAGERGEPDSSGLRWQRPA